MQQRLVSRPLHFLTALVLLLAASLCGCVLDNPDRQDNLASLARWEDQRLAPQDSLVAMLRHPDAHVRLAAVRTAGLIGRGDVLPQMIENLHDQSATVVNQTAFSLGLLGDDDAVDELVQMARDPHPATRVAALRGLAHLNHDGRAFLDAAGSRDHQEAAAAWDGLRNVAAEVDSAALREALLTGLAQAETDILWRVLRCCERTPWPDLTTAIAPHALSDNPQIRVHAYRALGRLGCDQALAAVIAGGRDAGPFVDRHRSRVDVALLRAVGSLGHHNFSEGEAGSGEDRDFLVTTLITGAGDAGSHVAVTALTAMADAVADLSLPREAAFQESLLPVWRIRLARAAHSHLDHPVSDVRRAAIQAWGLLRGSGAGEEIARILDRQLSPQETAAILFTLSRVHAAPLSILDRFAGPDSGVPPLVRTAALEGLAHLFTERSEALPQDISQDFLLDRLTAAAADSDFVVAATGAEMLGGFPRRLAVIALVELWDRAEGPERSDLQLAVLGALQAMGPGIQSVERPDTTGLNPDRLLGITRELLRESFDSMDIRVRYRGRDAAQATTLLPERLIPTGESLLATLPAFARSGDQALLTLPFKAPKVLCVTDAGQFVIKLDANSAPNTCASFLDLIRRGFYDDLIFHRVVPDFVVQGGCPRGDGWGGPGYTIRSEWSRARYTRTAVGIAHSGKDTGGSQFFVTLSEQPHLNGRYTIFGEVTDGMEVVDRINVGDHFQLKIMD
jgi:peptidyl-prolyl cis-trans isomerase B (cyclophilin B)